jgi:Fur family ferric uptake transcriptional regulator
MINQQAYFRQFIKNQGLRQSARRDRIVATFLALKGHTSAEALLARVRQFDARVGLSTIYRTLKLLTQSGLALERKFGGQVSTFEPVQGKQHHDHLICLGCGRIIEFENQAIEDLQGDVARRHAFIVQHHLLELYGYCVQCARRGKERPIEK